jgi:predicted enzyme related to lactoylglutathione lyase
MAAAPIVFFDIAGPDLASQAAFYRQVFGWEVAANGSVQPPVISSKPETLLGNLRTDPAERVLYLGVPDVTAALHDVVVNGGSIVAPRFPVPGVVILGLFNDPAGNRMGLVEMAGDLPKVP